MLDLSKYEKCAPKKIQEKTSHGKSNEMTLLYQDHNLSLDKIIVVKIKPKLLQFYKTKFKSAMI